MSIQENIRFHIHPAVFYHTYGEVTVLYHTGQQKVYIFNGTTQDVLNCFREYCSCEEAISKLQDVFNISDMKTFSDSIHEVIKELQDKGILVQEYIQKEDTNNLEREIAGRYFKEGELQSATLELTYKCNEKCRHCYIIDHNRKEMDTRKIISVLDELSEMGVFNIVLTGGEIFTRKDIDQILDYAYEKHFIVDIFTNGSLLDSENIIKLKSVWPRCVHFSLYSSIPGKHDAITRTDGSFEKTLTAIKKCVLVGIPVNIKTPVFSETIEDIPGLVKIANSMGVSIELGSNITPKKNGDLSPTEMRVTGEDNEKLVRDMINSCVETSKGTGRNNVHTGRICGAGEKSVSIDPYGHVFPCNMFQLCIGDLNTQTLRQIWQESEQLAWWRQNNQKNLKKGCEGCSMADECVFCPGEALMRNGDPLSMYSEACHVTKRFIAQAAEKGGEVNGGE